MKALDEIWKIYTLLHIMNPIWKPWKALLASVIRAKNTTAEKNSAEFHQTCSYVCRYILQNSHIFCNRRPNFTNFDAKLSGPCQQCLRKISRSPRMLILKFPEISQRKLSNFQKIVFEKLEKNRKNFKRSKKLEKSVLTPS